ncbi:MAG: iron-sulfur cluster assembly scaffold protein [Thaumarchaeota archaeon]|nr:iron-sulfur cluster assembly scaffold protein [Nitrososphaerota archaeon]
MSTLSSLGYNETVMEHFRNPRNMGEIANPDAIGTAGNQACGDVMTMHIGIKNGGTGNPLDDVIEDIKVLVFGCGAAIASSSVATELAKGKTLRDALKITKDDVQKALGGLPLLKLHCSVLATEALETTVKNYLQVKRVK